MDISRSDFNKLSLKLGTAEESIHHGAVGVNITEPGARPHTLIVQFSPDNRIAQRQLNRLIKAEVDKDAIHYGDEHNACCEYCQSPEVREVGAGYNTKTHTQSLLSLCHECAHRKFDMQDRNDTPKTTPVVRFSSHGDDFVSHCAPAGIHTDASDSTSAVSYSRYTVRPDDAFELELDRLHGPETYDYSYVQERK